MGAVHRGCFEGFQQHVEQFHLLGGQILGDEIRDDVQPRPLPQQPGCGKEIVTRGGREQQPAGILIDAEHHQRGLFMGKCHTVVHEDSSQDGG